MAYASLAKTDETTLRELERAAERADGVRKDWLYFLCRRDWSAKLDLTFRAGAQGCSVQNVAVFRAWEHAREFLQTLFDFIELSTGHIDVFIVMERQGRGMPHFHMLIWCARGWPKKLTPKLVSRLWQKWQGWEESRQQFGVQGYAWLRRYPNYSDITDVIKYVVKEARSSDFELHERRASRSLLVNGSATGETLDPAKTKIEIVQGDRQVSGSGSCGVTQNKAS